MANEEKDKKSDPAPMSDLPKAKYHSVLNDINKQLGGQELTITADVAGHTFFMSTLTADEEMWADGIMQVNSPAQAVSSFRMSRLAAAIKQIDGVSVPDLFQFPDEMNEERKREYRSSKYSKRTWEMGQVYMWLGELPMAVIDDLAQKYQEISKKRKESLDQIKNSSARTSGGKSKATSSPVRESSPVA